MNGKAITWFGLARLISRFTNPCILSLLVLLSITYTESSDLRALVVSYTTLLLFLIVLPLIYVYMRNSKSRGGTKLLADPTIFLKQHPRDVLILGALFGLPCLLVLAFTEAPSLLFYTLLALLVTSLLVAAIYTFYRVSYHLAAVTTLIIMAVLTWGRFLLVLSVAIPLVSWAKYRLHEHSPPQIMAGIALAVAVIVTMLYLVDFNF
jgi:hypothetical protein